MEREKEVDAEVLLDVEAELRFWVEEARWNEALLPCRLVGKSFPLTREFLRTGTVSDESFVQTTFREYEIEVTSMESSYVGFVPVSGTLFGFKTEDGSGLLLNPARFNGFLRRDGRVVFSMSQRRSVVPPITFDISDVSAMGLTLSRSEYRRVVGCEFDRIGLWPESFVDVFNGVDAIWRTVRLPFGTEGMVSDLLGSGYRAVAGRLGRGTTRDINLVSSSLQSLRSDDIVLKYPLLRRFLSGEGWHAVWDGEGLSDVLGYPPLSEGLPPLERSVVAASMSLVPGELLRAVGSDDDAINRICDTLCASLRVRFALSNAVPPVVVRVGASSDVPDRDVSLEGLCRAVKYRRDAVGSVGIDNLVRECSVRYGVEVDSLDAAQTLLLRDIVEKVSRIHSEESEISRIETSFFEFVQFACGEAIGSSGFSRAVERALAKRLLEVEKAVVDLVDAPSKFRRSRASEELVLRLQEDDATEMILAGVDSERPTISELVVDGVTLATLDSEIELLRSFLHVVFGGMAVNANPRRLGRPNVEILRRFLSTGAPASFVEWISRLPASQVGVAVYHRLDQKMEQRTHFMKRLANLESEFAEMRVLRMHERRLLVSDLRRERREREADILNDLVASLAEARAEKHVVERQIAAYRVASSDLGSLRCRRGEDDCVSFDDIRRGLDISVRADASSLATIYWRSVFFVRSQLVARETSASRILDTLLCDVPYLRFGAVELLSLLVGSSESVSPCIDLLIVEGAESVATPEVLALLPYVKSSVVMGNPYGCDGSSLKFSFLQKAQRSDRFSVDGFASLEFSFRPIGDVAEAIV